MDDNDLKIRDYGNGGGLFVYCKPDDDAIYITRYHSVRTWTEIEIAFEDAKALQSWLNERFGDEE